MIKPPHLWPRSLQAGLAELALFVLLCDMIAGLWPWFAEWWSNKAHFVVAAAVFFEAILTHRALDSVRAELATALKGKADETA